MSISTPCRFSGGVSALRIVSALAVVLLHAAIPWKDKVPPDSWLAVFNASMKGVCFFAVPVFVMISGYLLIGGQRAEPLGVFYKKRAGKILWPVVLWSAFYLGLRAVSGTGLTVESTLEALYYGAPFYHLWFLYMMVGLYLVAPFVGRFFGRLSLRSSIWVVVFLLAATWVYDAFYASQKIMFLLRFAPYLGLFCLGGVLRRIDVRLWAKKAAVLAVAGALFLGPLAAMCERFDLFAVASFYSYTGPVCTLFSLGVFVAGLCWLNRENLASEKALRWVGILTMNVYLIHPFWILVAEKLLMRQVSWLAYGASLAFILAASFTSAWALGWLSRRWAWFLNNKRAVAKS